MQESGDSQDRKLVCPWVSLPFQVPCADPGKDKKVEKSQSMDVEGHGGGGSQIEVAFGGGGGLRLRLVERLLQELNGNANE